MGFSLNDQRYILFLSQCQGKVDAAIVVNYDLPWAIIRLIQRAGRVDRIGQQSDTIACYSFLPAEGVERIIRLRERGFLRNSDTSTLGKGRGREAKVTVSPSKQDRSLLPPTSARAAASARWRRRGHKITLWMCALSGHLLHSCPRCAIIAGFYVAPMEARRCNLREDPAYSAAFETALEDDLILDLSRDE